MNPSPGIVVADRYRLERPLGQGGMGAVWLAYHVGLHIPCAVKFIHAQAAAVPEVRARFEREAVAAAQLRSPNVVQILDHGIWEGMPYIAMEMLEGEDLHHRLKRVGRLAPAEVLRIVGQIARALTKAHAVGAVHVANMVALVSLGAVACSSEVHVGPSGSSTTSASTGTSTGSTTTSTPCPDIPCGAMCVTTIDFCNGICESSCPEKCSAVCGPFTILAAGPGNFGPLALDDTSVYWANSSASSATAMDGTVMTVPKAGGMAATVISALGWVRTLAVDSTYVYWTESSFSGPGSLKMALKSGGPPTVLADGVIGLAIDAAYLYYWQSGSLERMPTGGGTPMPLTTNVSTVGIGSLAVDSANLYWTTGSLIPPSVNRVPIGGGNATQVATGNAPSTVVLDATSMYWFDADSNNNTLLRQAQLDGSNPQTVVVDGVPPYLAVDTTGVYWGTINHGPGSGGSIKTLALGEGTATILCTGGLLSSYGGMALDANYVYWTSEPNNLVMRTPK